MMPQTEHPTIFSVIHSDNPTVLNVLVDLVCTFKFSLHLLNFFILTAFYDGVHILVLFSEYFRVVLRGKCLQ